MFSKYIHNTFWSAFILLLCLFKSLSASPQKKLIIYPAPAGETLNETFKVSVNGQRLPVYNVKVNPASEASRKKAYGNLSASHLFFDKAAFGYFDQEGGVTVRISMGKAIRSAKILPTSSGISPMLRNGYVYISIIKPGTYIVEVNGDQVQSLQLFVNPVLKNVPKRNKNTLYFPPGIHYVNSIDVKDNATVYIAGGAIIRARIGENERYTVDEGTGLRHYQPVFKLHGKNIRFVGRGIIDASECTTHSRDVLEIKGNNILVDGIIIRDPPIWTIPVRNSSSVTINNVKIMGYRPNSDGIDVCNSRHVLIQNCYVRSNDDLIVIKTNAEPGNAEDIVVKRCVLWNQLAHALSIGAEVMRPIRNVVFDDCDIVHDKGIRWALRVYNTDSSTVDNVIFKNIRVEETNKLASLWIGKDQWSKSDRVGCIRNVFFKDIKAVTKFNNYVEIAGADSQHRVENVTFDNVKLNTFFLKRSNINVNEYSNNIVIKP